MSFRPGYFKPASGNHSPPVQNFVFCKDSSGARKRVQREVHTVWDQSHVVGSFVGSVECPETFRRKSKKRKGSRKSTTAFSRYTERNTNLERVGTMKPGTKLGVFKRFQNSQVIDSQIVSTTGSAGGEIKSERRWDSINPGPPYTTSSPLGLIKVSIPGPRPQGVFARSPTTPPNWWQYQGDFVDNGDWLSDTLGSYLHNTIPTIVGYDSLAWDKLKPQVEKANAGQFLVELRDLPTMVTTTRNTSRAFKDVWVDIRDASHANRPDWSKRFHRDLEASMSPKRLADNFLNHNFGWVPFLSDLGKIFATYFNTSQLISDIARDNGRWVRRRAVLESKRDVRLMHRAYYPGTQPWDWRIQGLCDTRVIDGIPCQGMFDLYEVLETKVWATGYFTFYRPEFDMNLSDNYIGALQRLATLYGVRITPSLIYKVTPWTWLVDWFTKFGNYVDRLDDFIVDGIVSRNLCVMSHVTRKVVKQSTIFFSNGQRTFSWERSHETKSRKIANSPYGFDQSWNNLSLRQSAILGAIGISGLSSGFKSRGA